MSKAKSVSKPVIIRKLFELKPYDKNAKTHTPEQVAVIAASIKEFGFRRYIEITTDDVIVNGHGRVLAAKSLGIDSLPCVVLDDMTDAQIRAYRLTDNKSNEGGYNADLLSQELYELTMEGEIDMSNFFSDKEMAFSIDDMGQIDIGGLSEDLASEVDKISNSTQEFMDGETEKPVTVQLALGFKTVDQTQSRTIRKFMDFAEGKTEKKGAEAFVEFCREYLGI